MKEWVEDENEFVVGKKDIILMIMTKNYLLHLRTVLTPHDSFVVCHGSLHFPKEETELE